MWAPFILLLTPLRIDGLRRAVKRAEGIGLLVGPTGCGKSLLLSCLREQLEGDYAVSILSGARICTRRGLWQSILSDLDEVPWPR